MLSGYPPFNGNNDEEILNAVKAGVYTLKGPEWENISDDAKDLISKMMEIDVSKRLTAA